MTGTDPDAAVGFRPDQLDGFRIGVTSDRRSEDLIAAFERREQAPQPVLVGTEAGHLQAGAGMRRPHQRPGG